MAHVRTQGDAFRRFLILRLPASVLMIALFVASLFSGSVPFIIVAFLLATLTVGMTVWFSCSTSGLTLSNSVRRSIRISDQLFATHGRRSTPTDEPTNRPSTGNGSTAPGAELLAPPPLHRGS